MTCYSETGTYSLVQEAHSFIAANSQVAGETSLVIED